MTSSGVQPAVPWAESLRVIRGLRLLRLFRVFKEVWPRCWSRGTMRA